MPPKQEGIIMKMTEEQLEQVRKIVRHAMNSPFYAKKFKDAGVEPDDIKTMEDFRKLPFTRKPELRQAYPLDIQAVPDEEIVRIHSSSGTTGLPIIIPYTKQDVEDWAIMFERCYKMAGITNTDRIHITPGYGLWTAGIGFQAGCERLGAMAIPMGPGNTEKQLKMMVDLKSTVLCSTSSYALLLAEEIAERGIKDKIFLKKGIIGSERWGDKMRQRIHDELGIELYDIYGLTEIYGPGISISCKEHNGLHYYNDYVYFEIINPETGENVPDGESGELVITTLRKQGAPLIRYRTHDITRLLTGECPCGCKYPRHDVIVGRSDDMTKVKGVNIYPGQIEDVLKNVDGASSEYQVVIDHFEGKDRMLLRVESNGDSASFKLNERIVTEFKSRIGIKINVEVLKIGELPRSEKKTKRIYDNRFN